MYCTSYTHDYRAAAVAQDIARLAPAFIVIGMILLLFREHTIGATVQ